MITMRGHSPAKTYTSLIPPSESAQDTIPCCADPPTSFPHRNHGDPSNGDAGPLQPRRPVPELARRPVGRAGALLHAISSSNTPSQPPPSFHSRPVPPTRPVPPPTTPSPPIPSTLPHPPRPVLGPAAVQAPCRHAQLASPSGIATTARLGAAWEARVVSPDGSVFLVGLGIGGAGDGVMGFAGLFWGGAEGRYVTEAGKMVAV